MAVTIPEPSIPDPPLPERRTAMYHSQLSMGAVMVEADGWQIPARYGDVWQESAWLRDTVGVSNISAIGKLRVVGADVAKAVGKLLTKAEELAVGAVGEADLPSEHGVGKLLAARLAADEFLLLTPPGRGPRIMDAMSGRDAPCAHVVDVTSGLSGVSIIGPSSLLLLSRITELDVSPRAMPDLTCAQARFAGIQGLLLRRDAQGIPIYQLYAGREYGEYLWEALIDAAKADGGGPVGIEALSGLRATG